MWTICTDWFSKPPHNGKSYGIVGRTGSLVTPSPSIATGSTKSFAITVTLRTEKFQNIESIIPQIELWQGFLRRYYPELVANPNRDLSLWHASYVQTYLERDVRMLCQIGDLTTFQNFKKSA